MDEFKRKLPNTYAFVENLPLGFVNNELMPGIVNFTGQPLVQMIGQTQYCQKLTPIERRAFLVSLLQALSDDLANWDLADFA